MKLRLKLKLAPLIDRGPPVAMPTASLLSLARFKPVVSPPHRRQQRHHRSHSAAGDSAGDPLAAEFGRVVNEVAAADLLRHRGPTHLLPPTAVIEAVLAALQRNDWPERDAGVRVAFAFTKPDHADATAPAPSARARSWAGLEEFLEFAAFSNQLHSPPYSALLECDGWRPVSALCFPSSRAEGRAVQAVQVSTARRDYTMSFCLERAEQGSLKGCWLVVGVRQGDYSL